MCEIPVRMNAVHNEQTLSTLTLPIPCSLSSLSPTVISILCRRVSKIFTCAPDFVSDPSPFIMLAHVNDGYNI